MKRRFFTLLHHRAAKATKPPKTAKPRRTVLEIERLEVRWLPSSITLALTNDTSGWQHLTSDGRLSGHITDDGYSVSGKTITFAGGVSGSTTTDSNGDYTYTPTLSGDGAYNSITASFDDHTP